MFFHICSVFIQLILTEEVHHLVPMGATEKIAVLMDVCVCMCTYVCTCTPRARVVQPAKSRSSASTRSQALTLFLMLTTIFDWKWSSILRSRFSMVVDLLAVESIKLSSLTYIITKLISLVIKVVNEIFMICLLFRINFITLPLFSCLSCFDNPLLPFIQSLIF